MKNAVYAVVAALSAMSPACAAGVELGERDVACCMAAAELDFKEPEIIPLPEKLTYEPSVAVRIDAATAFSVACPDESAASWVEEKVKAWFGAEPNSVNAVVSAGADGLGDEGYTLSAAPGRISISANSAVGVKYAMQSLRQAAERETGGMTLKGWWLPALEIRDRPSLKFRGVHFCWFPECSVNLMERLVRVAASYKFNYVVLESWGVFRSKRYPFLSLPGAPLDAAEAKRLVSVARDLGITIIPQVNIYGHAAFSRMIVGKHVALDYGPEHLPLFESYNGWNWCLSNPDARTVLKGFIEEVHEAFGNPPFFHIGCDEADPPSCPVCRAAKPYTTLVEAHIKDVADLLRERGARAMMWHDMLVEKGKWRPFYAHGSLDDAKMADTLPKDIVICDWYYGGVPEKKEGAELYPTMNYFASKGFSVVTCPWHNEEGIDAQAEYVRKKGYFGFLETVWNHYRGHKFAQAFERSACAAWGKCRERPPRRQGGFAFSMHWRKCGWDMGVPEYSETGLWGSQVSPDAHDD